MTMEKSSNKSSSLLLTVLLLLTSLLVHSAGKEEFKILATTSQLKVPSSTVLQLFPKPSSSSSLFNFSEQEMTSQKLLLPTSSISTSQLESLKAPTLLTPLPLVK